jgi:hypothetical protein
MPITLQSSIGGFSHDFMKQIPFLEKAMEEKGIEPSAFILAKNAAQYPVPYLVGGVGGQFDYTVFIAGESFTVTRQSDQAFLEYFYQCCLADEKDESTPLPEGLMDRFRHWLKGTPDFMK